MARAAELQVGSGERTEELSDDQIVELGKEVGLAPEHLRQALAEERTRAAMSPETGGLGVRLFGGSLLSASRTIDGTPREVLKQLDTWMQREECLQVKRHLDERIVWEPQRGLVSVARRALNVSGRSYALSQAHEVAATAVDVGNNKVLLRLDADFSNRRTDLTRGTVAVSAIGMAGSGTLATIGLVAAVAVPVGVLVGVAAAPAIMLTGIGYWAMKSTYERQLSRAQLALEQLLDRVERGDLTRDSSLLSALASAAANLPRTRF